MSGSQERRLLGPRSRSVFLQYTLQHAAAHTATHCNTSNCMLPGPRLRCTFAVASVYVGEWMGV